MTDIVIKSQRGDFVVQRNAATNTTGNNAGSGEGVYSDTDDNVMQFKTLTAGSGVTLVSSTNEIEISSLGGGGGTGWIRVTDVTANAGQTITSKTYNDPPNNTILNSATTSDNTFNISVECSYPNVEINGDTYTLPKVGSIYSDVVSYTLTAIGDVTAALIDPQSGETGDTYTIDMTIDLPAQMTTNEFTGGYPATQTELKQGDVFSLHVIGSKPFDQIVIQDAGAGESQVISFTATSETTQAITIADRGDSTQALNATVQIRDAANGALSVAELTSNTVNLNNLHPTVSIDSITYPASQGALKNTEQATIATTLANYDTLNVSSPNGDLTVIDYSTVQRLAGNYNVGTNNLQYEAIRTANGATTTVLDIVNIANVSAVINVSSPARLRSGGNNGTAAQDHTITITSNQQLYEAPSMATGSGSAGTWQGAWVGGPLVWTRALQVHDNDDKGSKSWGTLVATNLAGMVTSVISTSSTYILGGFVARDVSFQAFQTVSDVVNVAVLDYTKVEAGIWEATSNQSIRQAISTPPPVTDGFLGGAVGVTPHSVTWLDTAAASSNSGVARLFNYEEVI